MKHLLLGCALSLLAVSALAGVREIEIKPDPPGEDKQVFSLRFAPSETVTYDKITCECLLRQVIQLPTPEGGTREKIHEPIWFKYEEKGSKFVHDLDKYINFRVPINVETLRRTFGKKVFRPESEVTVSRMKITAWYGGRKAWSIKLDEWGKHKIDPEAIKIKAR